MRAGIVLTALLALPSAARASHPDLFGLGPEAIAHAGAGVADDRSWSASFTNPAGLAFAPSSQLFVGAGYTVSALSANGVAHPLPDPVGVTLGAVVRPRGDGWLARSIAVGLGAYVLPNTLAHLTTGLPDAPTFAYYEGRTERLVLLPSIAVRVHPRVSLGASLNVFAGLAGPASAVEGPSREVELTLSQQVRTRAAVILGVRAELTDHWALGITYRQRFSVPYATDTHNRVGGVPLDISVAAEGLSTPDEVVVGARWRGPRLGVLLDAGYARWRDWTGAAVVVRASVSGLALSPVAPTPNATDAFSLRAAADWRVRWRDAGDLGITLRAGLGVESAIVGAQPGRTNLLDHTRVIVGTGAELDLPTLWGVRTQLLGAVQVHIVPTTTWEKRIGSPEAAARDPNLLADEDATLAGVQTRNPGFPSVSGGGAVWAFSLGWRVWL